MLQTKLSVVEELAGLQLSTSLRHVSSHSLLARRVLGPQYRLSRSTKVDRTGKEVICLDTYQDMLGRQKLDSLGLTL
jgi:hypothetical protein